MTQSFSEISFSFPINCTLFTNYIIISVESFSLFGEKDDSRGDNGREEQKKLKFLKTLNKTSRRISFQFDFSLIGTKLFELFKCYLLVSTWMEIRLHGGSEPILKHCRWIDIWRHVLRISLKRILNVSGQTGGGKDLTDLRLSSVW